MVKSVLISLAVLIILSLSVLGVVYYKLYYKPSAVPQEHLFVIHKHSSLTHIAYKLRQEGLISYPWLFKYSILWHHKAAKMRVGEYAIPPYSSISKIVDILTSGKFYERTITIPEGFTVYQIVAILNNEKTLSGNIGPILPVEGSLMPTSLHYLRGTNRAIILNRLSEAQKLRVNEIWQNRDKSIPLKNKEELINIASIIEKEAKIPKERYLIASVFYNRLTQHIKLQSDPTVVYGIYGGVGKPKDKPIYKSDLANDNLYNTYKIYGLPKTPIDNPGYDSLYAAAHPVKSKFFYFVAKGNGTHVFSQKLEQHIKAISDIKSSKSK